ncbi:Fe-S cluster assembly protein HesB [Brevibacterium sp. BRM-1]|uniref:HhH-GPD-type base excision DNA repair protein n=1 Tax=Brevibacterium sp. BRM-1 TaxID=2999062 RepID=UPI00228042D7|nr:HhH-GPD-type base excision DNA repair protein [Brevibacterium sp. BRM-1]WAL40382.1 Fe-S cluster assembly protein HesB [Brevibacterium sp. BRM-1]
MTTHLYLSTDPQADELLARNPFALMVGMLLDQQISPWRPRSRARPNSDTRLGGLTPASVAGTDPEDFLAAFRETPAVHRFPGSMATRVQALAQTLVDDYDGRAENVWTAPNADGTEPTGPQILRRLQALPGFGKQKAQIFLALLGKQFGLRADGWREAAGGYGPDDSLNSIADVRDAATMDRVRANKQAAKAAAKQAKADAGR